MSIKHLFPIPLVQLRVPDDLITDTLERTLKYIKENDVFNTNDARELLTTYYLDDKKNFLGNIGAYPLLEFINVETRKYFELMGFRTDCYIEITSWLQLNQPGSYFVRHDHYGALTSGCVYLQTPEDCGDILFHNPLEARRSTQVFFQRVKHIENEYNFHHVKVPVTRGDMLMFESWIQHTVQENKSSENRISIGFNIWADYENAKS